MTSKVEDPGIMRIKNENGYLTLDLDGARVDTSALSPDHRKRLIELLTLIRPWLEGKPAAAPSMAVPPPPTTATPVPVQTAVTPLPSQPAAQKSSAIAKEDRPSTPANSIVG